MVVKRKAVSKLARSVKAASNELKNNADEEAQGQIVPVEERKEPSEQELVAARTKELKSLAAGDLKELLLSNGLSTGTKEVMIKELLKYEAKARKAAREQKEKIRSVVVKKKQELESLSTADLGKLCDNACIKGLRSKEERVQRLLVQWQENDGVDKALAEIAEQERKQELDALEKVKLEKLCTKIGVDPYVKEIMVERISKREQDAGCYSRPRLIKDDESPKEEKKGDMIEALLANEAQRKKEIELKNQQEDALAKRRKEIKALSVEDLKKRLAKKKVEASGKKEDMVDALFIAVVQEDASKARKEGLQSKGLPELKELASRYGLESGTKEHMVTTLLSHEAKCREELKAFEVKVDEMAQQKKKDLESKANTALKQMCAAKGLPVGGDKEERIERIVSEAQKDGEFDKAVAGFIRDKRKAELMSMDKPAVVKLCEKAGVDPVVKDIMVERIMTHEAEGISAIALGDAEPVAKRARLSRK